MEFDDSWIKKFEEQTPESKPQIHSLSVFYCYVDKDNTLHKINQEILEVTGNVLKRDELVRLIVSNKRKHQLLSILTYFINGNIDLNTNFHDFLQSTKIKDIEIANTHQALEPTNSIFFIFREISKKLKTSGTRKVALSSARNTRRKLLKANTPEV
jgi:hypothetical protein